MTVSVRKYLEASCDAFEKIGHFPLLEWMVLAHGREGAPVAHTYRKGKPGLCYMNAAKLADRYHELIYCEGFALRSGIGIGIQHAWCFDANDGVVDVTWDDSHGENSYMGITFDRDTLHEQQLLTGVYGVLDTGCGLNMPLLKQIDAKIVEAALASSTQRHVTFMKEKSDGPALL